jgi:multiple sugar transport system permease protein
MKQSLVRNKRFQDKLLKAGAYFLLVVGSILCLFPFAWMISTALKTPPQIMAVPIQWLPSPWTLENFATALQRFDFARYFGNSMLVAGLTTVLSVIITSLAGYAFAKRKFAGKEGLFNFLLATMTIPGAVLMPPLFLILLGLGWINHYVGVIVPFCVGVSNIFIMRQFISTIPSELEDAARIDGASEIGIWLRIILPLSRPAMATVAIFSFVGAWDGFLWPLIVLKDKNMWTLNVALGLLQMEYTSAEASPWGVMMAASLLTTLPLILIFLFFQRYLLSGLTLGAVKG